MNSKPFPNSKENDPDPPTEAGAPTPAGNPGEATVPLAGSNISSRIHHALNSPPPTKMQIFNCAYRFVLGFNIWASLEFVRLVTYQSKEEPMDFGIMYGIPVIVCYLFTVLGAFWMKPALLYLLLAQLPLAVIFLTQ
ncbi:hypothetical protein CVU37_09455 [candidate division BRC1 bacterium HGW-BRC1-1]|jgi:hypothetical protein|nr:MAG: hypothetical protein CVU37_09455 [candidate division BRC1 bacterium HGW-BRC1-1]